MPTKEQPVAGEEVGSPRLGVLGYALLCLLVRGPGPREKKTYTIAEAGRDALAAWLVRPPAPREPKDELLLKTYAVAAADPRQMRPVYLAAADESARRLAEYRRLLATFVERGAGDPAHPMFGNYATLRFGVAVEEQREAWCRWMETMLSEHAS